MGASSQQEYYQCCITSTAAFPWQVGNLRRSVLTVHQTAERQLESDPSGFILNVFVLMLIFFMKAAPPPLSPHADTHMITAAHIPMAARSPGSAYCRPHLDRTHRDLPQSVSSSSNCLLRWSDERYSSNNKDPQWLHHLTLFPPSLLLSVWDFYFLGVKID